MSNKLSWLAAGVLIALCVVAVLTRQQPESTPKMVQSQAAAVMLHDHGLPVADYNRIHGLTDRAERNHVLPASDVAWLSSIKARSEDPAVRALVDMPLSLAGGH